MRPKRDFIPGQLYGITQRGNQGQWVYRDDEDFANALRLMRKYAERYGVLIHGWCLMHNHGHWIFEASTEESISELMRDMQSRYSRYLNFKYKGRPWLLIGPLPGSLVLSRSRRFHSPFHVTGPVNWTPRFDAQFLTGHGFKDFLRYLENNPVRARMVKRASQWAWSSARFHAQDNDAGGLLSLDRWRSLFGDPATIGTAWTVFVEGPLAEEILNAFRVRKLVTVSPRNRPTKWLRTVGPLAAASAPS